ncbi:hypothetical protein D3C81_698700 [compost metagenome]
MQAVIHPLALTAVFQQVTRAQLRQVAGNLGLAFFQRAGQFTDAEFFLASDQQHHPNAVLVGEAFENLGRCQRVSHSNSQCLVFTRTNILMRS